MAEKVAESVRKTFDQLFSPILMNSYMEVQKIVLINYLTKKKWNPNGKNAKKNISLHHQKMWNKDSFQPQKIWNQELMKHSRSQ